MAEGRTGSPASKRRSSLPASARGLRRKVRQLRAVITASAMVNSMLDLESIAEHVLSIATSLLQAERGSLFLLDRETETLTPLVAHGVENERLRLKVGEGIVGTVARTGRAVILDDPYADPRFNPRFDHETGFRTRSLLTVPVRDRRGELVAVLQLLNHKGHPFNREDARFLAELGVPFAIALLTAQMHRKVVERERLREELRLAAEIQRTMQPVDFGHVPGLDVRGLFKPCLEVGGDYFDLIPTHRGSWWLVMADVSGKGVSGALVASNLQAYLWSRRNEWRSLDAVMAEGNDLLLTLARGKKYATLALAEWQPETRTLLWANAGHPPILLKKGGAVLTLGATGVPLGLLRERTYRVESTTLEDGDMFLMFTDGVTEAGGEAGKQEFGLDRVSACVSAAKDAGELVEAVDREVALYLGAAPARDDITLLCARCQTSG